MRQATFTVRSLSDLFQLSFTDEQLDAITAPVEPNVVIAGAGSGKTTVMSARVVWLVAQGLVDADSVLGLTFTNKAASQLSARIRRGLSRLAASGFDAFDGEPTVATYHAYAASMVREYGLRDGLEPAARLLTDASRYQLAERVVRRAPGPFEALKYRVRKLTEAVVTLDGELNEHLVTNSAVHDFDDSLVAQIAQVELEQGKLTKDPANARDAALARNELIALVASFREEKRRVETVDFGDLMASAAALARRPEIAAAERDRYSTVLLDEYQDTSVAQKVLLLELFGGGHSVTAVGDPFQAIYGWRGASVHNIMSFAREFKTGGRPAAVFPLAQNNRSDQAILDVANRLAEPLRNQFPVVQPLTARLDRQDTRDVTVGLFTTRDQELNSICDDIAARIDAGTQPQAIAVLCRDSQPFAALHRGLTAREVPVEVVGLGGLLALPEVVDVVAVLSVLDDPAANPDMVRVLTSARWRIGPRDLALLGRRAGELVGPRPNSASGSGPAAQPPTLAASLQEAVTGIDPAEVVSLSEAIHDPGRAAYSAEARSRFAQLDAELSELRAHLTEPLPDLVRRVIEAMGLDVEVAASSRDVHTHRPSILAQFVAEVGGFADLEGSSSLAAFLAYLQAASEFERGLDVTSASTDSSVKVMTAHKAKGLEWPVVFVPCVSQRVFPSGRGRPLWTSTPSALPFALRGDATDFPDVDDWSGNKGVERFKTAMKQHDEAEERRLAYVAFTRAEHTLVVTGHWWGPTQQKVRGPSPYLTTAHEFCAAGGGRVMRWDPEPTEGTNPSLSALSATPWPTPLNTHHEAARQEGAALVRQAIATALAGEQIQLPIGVPERVRQWDDDLAALLAEASQLHESSRIVTVPSALSTSRAIQLVSDPQRFGEELARPMPRRPAVAARRGTAFHAWVESLFGQRPLIDLEEMTGSQDESEHELDVLREAFLAGPFAERIPVAIEAPFQLVLGGRAISGRIDAIYQGGGRSPRARFEVVDWKTGSSLADPLQLAIYRLAWAELNDVPLHDVAAAFYYVATNSVDYHEDLPDRESLEQLLSADST